MPDVHARFSPSSAERYIRCPPSLILGEEVGPEDTGSDYSREGTDAHSVCEYLLRTALGEQMEDPRPNLRYYNEEMQSCAEGYRDEILSIYESLRQTCPDPAIFVEQKVSLEDYVEDCFGTSDCIIIGGSHMYVCDYKHGMGVPVSAEENSQLKCYALGAYLAFGTLYDIEEITLVIYQPRISNYSQWSLTVEALLSWADTILRPAGEMALHGEGDYACGSWCRFCKAKAVCRKRAEENLAMARYDFARPQTLEDDEVNVILERVDALVSWANDVKEYAMQRALSGYAWDKWKLVEGRSVRRFTDEKAVAKAVEDAGYDPYQRKLLTLTDIQKMLGKKKFNDILGEYVSKPQGKPTLVSRADPRPEMNNVFDEFKEEN